MSGHAHARESLRRGRDGVALGLALAITSLGTVQEYVGTAAAVAYLLALPAVGPLAERYVLPRFVGLMSERSARLLAAATYAGLVVVFAVVYPIADHDVVGSGSDRDDASDLATGRLLDGEYPYRDETYLGNPVSQLPGALVFAVPFVALGASAYQNVFWIPLFFVALARHLSSTRLALFAAATLLLTLPGLWRELLTGGDLIANGIYVALLMLVVLRAPGRPWPPWIGLVAAVLLGVALSSRANYVFGLVLLGAALARNYGRRVAAVRIALACAGIAAITLPFWLYDRNGFTPLTTSGKLGQFDVLVPHVAGLTLAAGILLTLVLALRRFDRTGFLLMTRIAIVQLFFLVIVVVLDSVEAEGLDFSFLVPGYGLIALPFAVLGLWGPWSRYRADAATSS